MGKRRTEGNAEKTAKADRRRTGDGQEGQGGQRRTKWKIRIRDGKADKDGQDGKTQTTRTGGGQDTDRRRTRRTKRTREIKRTRTS